MEAIVENEQGGRQSFIEEIMTEVPPVALLEVAKVMGKGASVYPREPDGTPNWHKIDCVSNLDHALRHAVKFLVYRNFTPENRSHRVILEMTEELNHTAARSLMALEQWLRNLPNELEYGIRR